MFSGLVDNIVVLQCMTNVFIISIHMEKLSDGMQWFENSLVMEPHEKKTCAKCNSNM